MIHIGHLFPDLMNLYGEYANVVALRRRLEDAGEEVSVRAIRIGEELDLKGMDFLYIGGGTDGAMVRALHELRRNPGLIGSFAGFGGLVLLTGNASAILCSNLTVYGDEEKGLEISGSSATLSHSRRYAEYIMASTIISSGVVGAINTSIEMTPSEKPLFQVICTSDSRKNMQVEGYLGEGIYATSLIGPLLVRNPALLTWFAEKLAGHELPAVREPWGAVAEAGFRSVLTTLHSEIQGKG